MAASSIEQNVQTFVAKSWRKCKSLPLMFLLSLAWDCHVSFAVLGDQNSKKRFIRSCFAVPKMDLGARKRMASEMSLDIQQGLEKSRKKSTPTSSNGESRGMNSNHILSRRTLSTPPPKRQECDSDIGDLCSPGFSPLDLDFDKPFSPLPPSSWKFSTPPNRRTRSLETPRYNSEGAMTNYYMANYYMGACAADDSGVYSASTDTSVRTKIINELGRNSFESSS